MRLGKFVAVMSTAFAAVVLMVTGARADSCSSHLGQDVTSIGSCTVDGLTFSNFAVEDAGGDPNPNVVIVLANILPDGTVILEYNPNLDAVQHQDIHFSFQVAGVPIDKVDLSNGGIGQTSIAERVCDSQGLQLSGACKGSELATMIAFSGQSTDAPIDPAASDLWVWKDISKGACDNASTCGHLTAFTQSFHTVPEPATLLLIGSGLVGAGLFNRKRSRSVSA